MASPPAQDRPLFAPEWDFTEQARHYHLRPNYAPEAVDALCELVRARSSEDFTAADVGAGTGNLTLLLAERGARCVAVEPNEAMLRIGAERTRRIGVPWVLASGESTTLTAASADLFALGSSFVCMRQADALAEAHRVLKPGGSFACLYNHRDLDGDSIQRSVEAIFRDEVPGYRRGGRRDDQTAAILAGGLFTDVHLLEARQEVRRSVDAYLDAWRSVRNPSFDAGSPEGARRFERVLRRIRAELGDRTELAIPYVTRCWVARRVDG